MYEKPERMKVFLYQKRAAEQSRVEPRMSDARFWGDRRKIYPTLPHCVNLHVVLGSTPSHLQETPSLKQDKHSLHSSLDRLAAVWLRAGSEPG
jgi:hypothetical protein